MRYYLFLLVIAICEARIIKRGIDYTNLQTVYHGHGATSYQNVQIDNHNSIIIPANYRDQAEIADLGHHAYYQPIIQFVETHNDIDDISHSDISYSAPYEEFIIADVNSDVYEHYFNHDDETHDYDLHIYE
ncbi:uncharacterized protein LOC114929215 [Nylanderia fulva]|uniref:uncharacterized protein LOC114929215 n=1 Tax=Nylanderia fulva TaxID=613905 RepID=UPI0010FAE470|nr:uncharacterized protein LOC114929215 [Nylanderia fulva]